MTIRKHMLAFSAAQELIGAQVDSFMQNPPHGDSFEIDEDLSLESIGLVHSAVSSGLRQMKSDLNALNHAHPQAHSHEHQGDSEQVHGSGTADAQ